MRNFLFGRVTSLAALLMASLLLPALPAAAQSTPFYIGGGAGLSSIDLCGDPALAGATSCDDEDTGFKIFGGYNFNQNFGVELGWVDLGEISVSGPGGTATAEADGFQAAAVGILPINPQFSIFGKLGVYMWDAEVNAPGISASDDGTDLMFGVGGAFHFTPQLSIRAEWERFEVDDEDADLISASIVFRF